MQSSPARRAQHPGSSCSSSSGSSSSSSSSSPFSAARASFSRTRCDSGVSSRRCLTRLARFELDRGQRFDFDHRAGGTPCCPARLIQQCGVDEQRVSASNPSVERAELIAAKDFHGRQREDQQVAARRRVELGQPGITLAKGTHLDPGTAQPFEQASVPVAAPFGGGRPRGIGVRIQRRCRTQPQAVERRERSERQQESDAAFAHQRLPAARRANLSSNALAEVTVPSSCSSGGGLLP